VTGTYISGPFDRMARLLHDHFPSWKRVGTLFCPAEANSVAVEAKLRDSLAREGIGLDSIAATTPADLPDAAAALAARPIDAIVQLSDNQGTSGFPAIVRAARRARKPLAGFNATNVDQGAAFALAVEYHDAGKASGSMVARVLRGTPPADIPFHDFSGETLRVDEGNAKALGFRLPASLVAAAAATAAEPVREPSAAPTRRTTSGAVPAAAGRR
jgi:ABC-type uncharacterized transport system substrate-binding protein